MLFTKSSSILTTSDYFVLIVTGILLLQFNMSIFLQVTVHENIAVR